MEITGKRGPEGVVKAVCTSEKKVLKNILADAGEAKLMQFVDFGLIPL